VLKLVASQWISELLAKAKGVHKNTRIYLFRPGNCKNISHATQKQHRAATREADDYITINIKIT
jgi:hypothetical protein